MLGSIPAGVTIPSRDTTMELKRHIYIPDTQIRPGVPLDHLLWLARFIADHRLPDHLQFAGDWWDMPSLSSYAKKGSKSTEGKRIKADRDAGYEAMAMFQNELMRLGVSIESQGFTMGNHEHRHTRFLEENPDLIGEIIEDPHTFYGLDDFGIRSAQFMEPMHKHGVTYCHLFDINASGDTTGRRAGQPNARMQVRRVSGSSVAGHKQGYDIAHRTHPYARSWQQETFAVIAGSFYQHKEGYRGPTDGYEKRGVVVINGLNKWGAGDPQFVSMNYLRENYGD